MSGSFAKVGLKSEGIAFEFYKSFGSANNALQGIDLTERINDIQMYLPCCLSGLIGITAEDG